MQSSMPLFCPECQQDNSTCILDGRKSVLTHGSDLHVQEHDRIAKQGMDYMLAVHVLYMLF